MAARVLDGKMINIKLNDSSAYDGVHTRRILALLIDYLIVGLLMIPFTIVIFFLGILTLALGWALFGVLSPMVALLYIWMTLGGPNQKTTGMRMMKIRIDRLYSRSIDVFWLRLTRCCSRPTM